MKYPRKKQFLSADVSHSFVKVQVVVVGHMWAWAWLRLWQLPVRGALVPNRCVCVCVFV
jgi:hypothetical protein